MRRENTDGLSISHQVVMGAARVVLVHGTMDRSSSLRKVARRLADLDVTLYDRRGYGESVDAGVATTIERQVDDLIEVIDGRPSVLFGHSLGGVIALGVAARRPRLVPAVVVYEAPLSWMPWWPRTTAGSRAVYEHGDDPAQAAEAFMRQMVGDQVWARLPERTRAARRAEGPALLAEMRALRTEEAPFRVDRIDAPVVVARGTETAAHHRRAAAELADALPTATLVDVEGAGHGAHLTHPEAVAELIRGAVAGAHGR